jgi:myo-inositol-1(or 4)-monophosphatase
MDLKNCDYIEEVKTAVDAARAAGEIMDEYVTREINVVERKSSFNDVVTEADKKCQVRIVEKIESEFPGDGFLAEENGLEPEGENRVWVIDPIDGTFNFSKGFPYFCTSIALKEDGKYVLGVVLSPKTALSELYIGVNDFGSFRTSLDKELADAERIEVSNAELQGSRVAVDFSDMESKKRYFEGEVVNGLLEDGAAFSRPGAAAVNACMVARGSLDGWISHCAEWDFAAGKIIIEEAGGVLDFKRIESSGLFEVVASNGVIQPKLLKSAKLNYF